MRSLNLLFMLLFPCPTHYPFLFSITFVPTQHAPLCVKFFVVEVQFIIHFSRFIVFSLDKYFSACIYISRFLGNGSQIPFAQVSQGDRDPNVGVIFIAQVSLHKKIKRRRLHPDLRDFYNFFIDIQGI